MSKTALLAAVQHLDLAETRRIVGAKPTLLAIVDRQGRNLLQLACAQSAAIRGTTELLDRGAKVANARLLAWLVRHGASPDIKDREGVSPRLKASRKRNRRFFEALQ